MPDNHNLTYPISGYPSLDLEPIVVVGEILWDVFPETISLGGAPLNFAAHARRLDLLPILISCVGNDDLGERAMEEMVEIGLDTSMVGKSCRWPTGTASVAVDGGGQPTFTIQRPAAYDDVHLTAERLLQLRASDPSWVYYGTLFPSLDSGMKTLREVLRALPDAVRMYDVNLRPGSDSCEVVSELISMANVVKLNEFEAGVVSDFLGLPTDLESFCRSGVELYGWSAVCITLGDRGCALFDGRDFVSAASEKVVVADTVGAGDAFAAAFLFGLLKGWPAAEIAQFANRVGGLVASRAGAIPEWNLLETATT